MHFFSHTMKAFVFIVICIAAGGYVYSGSRSSGAFSYHGVRMKLPARWSAQGDMIPPNPLYEGKDLELRKKSRMYTNKGGYENMPRHVRIRFNCPDSRDNKAEGLKAEISIHSVEEYSHIFEPDTEPESVLKSFERILQTAVSPMDHKINQELPLIPPFEGYESMVVCFKQIDQPFFKGFRFITQFHSDASLIRNAYLYYIFQGISADKTQYILATFPVKLDGLAKSNDKDHLGFSTRDYDAFEKDIKNYYLKAARWIEKNESKMRPSLTSLDDILRSTEIDN
jgi:hypothetical protein